MRATKRHPDHSRPRALALACTALLGLACDPAGLAPVVDSPRPTAALDPLQAHVLARTAYGADTWTVARIEALGVDGYLDEQLTPAGIADPEVDAFAAARPTLEMDFHDLLLGYPTGGPTAAIPLINLIEMKLLRSIHTRRQLEQVLVDFWFDHFSVYGADNVTIHDVTPYERDAIRPHVLGRFEDMLRAVARSPAMLYYLDNYLSSREGYVLLGEVRGLNENYARELLELHTVGVDRGYDQNDVIEVARALTGWTIGPPALTGPDGFLFVLDAHDQGAKSIMGQLQIPPGGGEQDGHDVITYLAAHPNTADFLCTKLVARFVDETPPPAAVAACASAYRASGGDLRATTRAVLFSPEFRDTARAGTKVKRPLHFLASLIRALDIDIEGVEVDVPDPQNPRVSLLDLLAFFADLLGEPPYLARPPTGFPDESEHWANAGGLITRLQLIYSITFLDGTLGIDWGTVGGTNAEVADAVTRKLMPGGVSEATRGAVLFHLAGWTGFPTDFRAREAAGILLASPDFMMH